MSATTMTVSEMANSLTGFDEIAITTHMGYDVYDVGTTGTGGQVKLIRALIFVAKMREGLTTPEAKNAALSMTGQQASDFFASDPDEIDPDDPETEAGKDSTPPA